MTDLPDGWIQLRLDEVARWGSGGTPKAGTPEYYGGSIPWAVIGDLNDGIVVDTQASITQAGLNGSSAKIVEQGTLLVAMYGSIGKLGIAGRSMATNQAIAFARPDKALTSTGFLFHFIRSQRDVLARAGKGATQKNISQTILKSWPTPVPPLNEQDEIVRILDTQLARLDAVLGAVQTIRQKAAQFRRALLRDAFSGQLTQPNPARGSQLPDGWTRRALGDLAHMSLGKMVDAKANDGLHPTPYLRNANIQWGISDLADLAVMDIPPEQLERVTAEPGDLIVCEGGEPGRTVVWRGKPTAIQKALHRVRVTDEVAPDFVYFFLEREFRGVRSHPLFTGTTIKHLPKEKFKTLEISFPSRREQADIVQILESQLSRLDDVLRVADRVEVECGRLRRSLLQAAFSGELTRRWRESHV